MKPEDATLREKEREKPQMNHWIEVTAQARMEVKIRERADLRRERPE